MPRFQYAGTPPTPPPPTVTLRAGSTTSAVAGAKSIWLQYRNRAGYSQVSNRVDVVLAAGQGLDITIPLAALPSPNGCCIWEYTILMSNTTALLGACVVATVPGYEADESTILPPPFTVPLTQDSHFELSRQLIQSSQLPSTNRIHGMRRGVDELSAIVEWDSIANQWLTVTPPTFNTGLTANTYGANQDTSTIPDLNAIIKPTYTLNGADSIPIGYWLVNDTTQSIPQGRQIALAVDVGDQDVSYTTGILGGLTLIFRGYVNTTNGVLDTSGMTVGTEPIPYQGKRTGLALQKALPAGSAFYFDVILNVTPDLLPYQIIQGATLGVYCNFYANFAAWSATGDIFGDLITQDLQQRRILPATSLSCRAMPGSGNITLDTGGSCTFQRVPEQAIFGFAPNQSSQQVWIGVDGSCIVAPVAPAGTRKRAVISTQNGVGTATSWNATTVALSAASLLRVTVTYANAIRGDYPDVIAGTPCPMNATAIRVYVQPVGGGNITAFETVVAPGSSQVVVVGSTAGLNVGTSIPTALTPNFGLFKVEDSGFTVAAIAGDSVFASGTYRVAVALFYSNTITSISHSTTDGCIYEAGGTMADLFSRSRYYNQPASNLAASPHFDAITPYESCLNLQDGERYYFKPDALVGIRPPGLTNVQPGRWVKEKEINNLIPTILVFGGD